MKKFIFRKLIGMHNKIRYVMVACFLVLLLFIAVIYQNEKSNHNNSEIAILGAITAFSIVLSLLFRLEKDRKFGKKVKNNLATHELKYRNLIENAGIVVYTTSLKGDITFASSKAIKLTRYNLKELIGMNFSEIIDFEYLDPIRDKYLNQIKNNIKETLFEFPIRTKYGDLKWVEQSAVLMIEDEKPVGFQCVIRDISERKEMEDVLKKYEIELVQNQERLQSILDNATSLIYIKDLEGRYLLTNKKFKEVLNVSESSVIGKTDFEITDEKRANFFRETDKKVINTRKHLEIEDIIDMPDGKHHILIVKFPLINAQDEVYGISGIATDITERVKQRSELIKAKKIAEDAKRLQEQFLANMSHEIRTPMNGIQGMTDLLLETQLNEEQRDFAKTIKRSSDNLIVIINDILDFSKIKAGKLTIEKIDFDLNEIIESLTTSFRHRAVEKGLSIEIKVDNDVPLKLVGDPYRLNQILVNLIGNAVKFTHHGGIKISISVKKKTDSEIVLNFSIADTGIGIEMNKMNEIFESFTQASVDTSRKYGGTGLGLSITKQLLELQKGNITVESKINCGTTFRFSIPYTYGKTDSTQNLNRKDINNYSLLLKGKKFLVAEDNEVNQKVIRQVLQKAGSIVDITNNGLEAISFLKNNSNYDLLIMDLQMPEMDGYAATKYIRNVMRLSIPIMAMTASALKGEKAKCLEIGMNDYLSKPFDFNFLYKRIGLLLEKKSGKDHFQEAAEIVNNKLFDLADLEEMDDNDYMMEILSIFLNNTPAELKALQQALASDQFETVYKIAHKLKSSAGIFKAADLLQILVEIEMNAADEKKEILEKLFENANVSYKKIEIPLKEKLKNIQAWSGLVA